MKNISLVLSAAALMLAAASCVKDTNTETVLDYARQYELSFDPLTRTEISSSGTNRSVSWNVGDVVRYYTEPKQSSPAEATVSLSGDKAYVTIPRGRTDEFINAVYGATQIKSSSSTDNCMYVTSLVKSNQRYTSFSEVHICAAFSDDLEDPNLRFHNAACIVHFTSAVDVHKVVFSGNNGEIINAGSNGDLKISYSSGALTVESVANGSSATNQTSVSIATNGEESDFYFAILPVCFDSGIMVQCFDSYGALMFTKKTGGSLNTVTSSGAVKMLDLGKAQDWIATAPPEPIDLGLSVKWASYNVGATKPEEYGDYFAWGETAPKNEYKWANYLYGTAKNGPFSKYVLDAGFGTVDHKLVLDIEDDAAHANWGGEWRLPSKEEVSELMTKCTWTWTERNGINGYNVSRNGNSIFLPANGMRSSSLTDEGTVGNYWSSSISGDGTYYSISPYFSQSYKKSDNCYRYFGLGIRPVYGAIVPVSKIALPETLILTRGITESATLNATVIPDNATYKNLTWVSSNESVATVNASGIVTAVTLGSTTVSAFSADGAKSASCVVTVKQYVTSITLDKTYFEMYVDDASVTLIATIFPDNATDKGLIWTSSNPSVATVDEEGRVTAVSAGTATITATASDGSGTKASCAVTVYSHVESVSLDRTELTIFRGESHTLSVTISPSTTNKTVIWTSSDESVAIVDEEGNVTAVSLGKATVTVYSATEPSKTSSCEITVIMPKPQVVDLGLPSGLKWASCNLGATKPEEYGDYFAWGETAAKSNYDWSSYKFLLSGDSSTNVKFKKYCPSNKTDYWGGSGSPDNKTVLDLEDDAAHANLGGNWRMPTDAEWTELKNNCTWTWTNYYKGTGIVGQEVRASNGNSIFFPATGKGISIVGPYGRYWSSSLNMNYPYQAFIFYFNSDSYYRISHDRYYGYSVRPVSK